MCECVCVKEINLIPYTHAYTRIHIQMHHKHTHTHTYTYIHITNFVFTPNNRLPNHPPFTHTGTHTRTHTQTHTCKIQTIGNLKIRCVSLDKMTIDEMTYCHWCAASST